MKPNSFPLLSVIVLALVSFTPVRPAALPPTPQKRMMPSGLTVIVRPMPGQPILAARLFVRAGAAQEQGVPAGTAAVLARLLVTEAAHPSIRDRLAFLDDQVGGGLTAEPGEDAVDFSVLTTPDRLDAALDLLAFIVTAPRLRPPDIDAQRRDLEASAAEQPDPFQIGIDAFLSRLYPESRWGLSIDGDTASRQGITVEALDAFWRERYRLGDMILVLAGDVRPERAMARADEAFRKKVSPGASRVPSLPDPPSAGLPSGSDRAVPAASADDGPKDRPSVSDAPRGEARAPGGSDADATASETILERPVPVGAAVVGVRAPGALDPDFPALSVLSALLGGGKGSRLFRALRGSAGIGYDLGAWSPPRARNGYLAGYVIADPFRTSPDGTATPLMETARKTILAAMQSVAGGHFTDAELTRARRYVIGSYALRHQRVADVAYLLGWWEAIGAGYGMDADFPRRIDAVSRDAVAGLARRLLRGFTSLVVLPDRFRQPGSASSMQGSDPSHYPSL